MSKADTENQLDRKIEGSEVCAGEGSGKRQKITVSSSSPIQNDLSQSFTSVSSWPGTSQSGSQPLSESDNEDTDAFTELLDA
eukprot:765695-Hanusia_phi.AAC.1